MAKYDSKFLNIMGIICLIMAILTDIPENETDPLHLARFLEMSTLILASFIFLVGSILAHSIRKNYEKLHEEKDLNTRE